MYKFWLSVCVIIILVQTQNISGDLSIDQRIREGNRKRALDVRLVGGSSSLEGRIEIRYNNTWGTVCDKKFNRKAAKVICHMLGYQRAGAKAYKRATYGKGKGPIWLDKLRCHGNEISVKDCRHLPWGSHSCRHKDDAGVKCKAKKKVERDRMTTLELDMVVEENNKHKIFHRYNYNKNAAKDTSKRWARGTIFYKFNASIDSNTGHLIRDAFDEWEYFSCLHFAKDVLDEHYNRIVFTYNQDDKGCASTYVEMKQGS
ncbi:scavenger receptor cysteine-rich domain superfamily protein-like [Mercenaria mercenaria]|uniref:scavenger receptor cysteine-rich domain superfamily protein-like n=1 Tax=Mercenaria mercenaria TaxID=6596 RepID=UPI00234E522B|nr:scavenger receptor cysteine-rich domain superfamily protein-like [Mercenaria mercenaria]XP_053381312.1 scavenger receptor cysteine-rich domain superfamily protein-like [Mercenaria mercenaria]